MIYPFSLARGASNREVSEALYIAGGTVKNHPRFVRARRAMDRGRSRDHTPMRWHSSQDRLSKHKLLEGYLYKIKACFFSSIPTSVVLRDIYLALWGENLSSEPVQNARK
jgi:hypothetical protein